MAKIRNLSVFLLITLSLGFTACGKSSSKSGSASSLLDFTQYDVVQFKAASSNFGTSGTRYDLNLGKNTVEMFSVSNDEGTYQSVKKLTLNAESKAALTSQMQKVSYQKYKACSNCQQTRASVWVEITETAKPLYFFANQGDCSCPSDGENAPTIPYDDLKESYDEILSLF